MKTDESLQEDRANWSLAEWAEKFGCSSLAQEGQEPERRVMSDETKARMLEVMAEDECRPIWDTSCKEYKNRVARGQAFQRVSQRLAEEGHDVDGADWVRYNYNNMSTVYQRIKRQQQQSQSASEKDSVAPRWQFYNLMEALQANNPTRLSTPSMVPLTSKRPKTRTVQPTKHPSSVAPANENDSPSISIAEIFNFNLENGDTGGGASSSRDSPSVSGLSLDAAETPPTFLSDAAATQPTHNLANSRTPKKRKIDSSIGEQLLSSFADNSGGSGDHIKAHADNLASMLASLCVSLEEKQPGSSAEICLGMCELIHKATRNLYNT